MSEKKNGKKIGREGLLLIAILFTGSLVRLICLDKNPMGLHQDEAYSAYNAWAVMHYGVDSYGYVRPVYYTVWGSGMSVLYSWLTMPFLAVMGISVWAIRLPQAILGSVSILAAYGLGKEMSDSRTGLLFAGALAINPWHIQQSRFGLDANLAVPMFLFAMYFLCRYLNGKRKSIWGVSVFLGLTLYSYALTWIFVPGVLVLCLIFFRKRFRFDKRLLGAAALLFAMALPLLLFLAVNFDWIPEIRTSLFSIPKLPALRTGEMEFSLSALKRRFLWMVAMLWAQHDDIWWITNEAVGSYYYISTPFILIGIGCHIKVFAGWMLRKRKLPLHFLISLWFAMAFAVGCCIDTAKYYKVNSIHIPIILYGVLGVLCVCRLLGRIKWKAVAKAGACAVAGMYLAAFGCYLYSQASFGVHYENYGYSLLSHMHWYKYEEAIRRAAQLTDGEIGILSLNYANVMLCEEISPYEYMESVVYQDEGLAFREVLSIGRYHFDRLPGEDTADMVFVYPYNMEEACKDAGFVTEYVTECYGVAYQR